MTHAIDNSVTMIQMSVNGHLVPFTFVGHPSKEYMEQARKAAERIEKPVAKAAALYTPPKNPRPTFKVGQEVDTRKHGKGTVVREAYGVVEVAFENAFRCFSTSSLIYAGSLKALS